MCYDDVSQISFTVLIPIPWGGGLERGGSFFCYQPKVSIHVQHYGFRAIHVLILVTLAHQL